MEAEFGDAYRQYRQRTSRFIPLPKFHHEEELEARKQTAGVGK